MVFWISDGIAIGVSQNNIILGICLSCIWCSLGPHTNEERDLFWVSIIASYSLVILVFDYK